MASNLFGRTTTQSFARLRGAMTPTSTKPVVVDSAPAPDNDVPPPPVALPGEGPTIIATKVTMKGSIASPDELQVYGVIEGDARGRLIVIGAGGAVQGDVIGDTIVVAGTVEGRIFGGKVQLIAGGHVSGDIMHEGLAIEAGAMFEGIARRATTAAA